jgi:hypothetical protein
MIPSPSRTAASTIAVLLAAVCMQAPAHAAETGASTWRCGNTYTDQPCQGGKAIALDDAPDATRKREADAATREARTTADRMERERQRTEAELSRQQPVLIDSKPPAAKAAPPKTIKKGKKEAEGFSAQASGAKKPAKSKKKKT